MKWHKPLLRRLLYILNSAGIRRTDVEGQRLFTSCWDHKFPLRLPISNTVKRQTLLFRKELKLPDQTGAKAEAGPKNISLPQKCPHVLALPKECLLVCVSTYLLRAEWAEMFTFGLWKGLHISCYFSVS